MRRDQRKVSDADPTTNYASSIIKIGSFDSAEGFFGLYDHLQKPSSPSCVGTDYHLFREGVTPTWEDSHNKNGGKWIIRLRKGDGRLSSLYWEELLLAIIGEKFGDLTDHISGAVVSIRSNDDIISLWNVDANDQTANNEMRDIIRETLQLPSFVQLEYKKHARSRNLVWHRQNKPIAPRPSTGMPAEDTRVAAAAAAGGPPISGYRSQTGPTSRPDYQTHHHQHRDRSSNNNANASSNDRDWSTLRKKS